MDKKTKVVRILLSAFLLFHVFGVILTPNQDSFAFRALSPIYAPYMRSLGLAYSWGFFAPEPIAPPMYIDYILDQKNALPISGRFPPEKNPYFFRDRYNRSMSLSKFILGSDDNLKNMFMNYMCHEYPNTESGKLWRVTGLQPSLEQVQSGEKKMTDAIDYHIEVLGTYFCPEKTL